MIEYRFSGHCLVDSSANFYMIEVPAHKTNESRILKRLENCREMTIHVSMDRDYDHIDLVKIKYF